ncbi:MAG: hypothetical protein FJ090_22490 [Deltaproteobacteria bacterium]|nr:hypothetical protein [Deltaproteobacteria bacterium]
MWMLLACADPMRESADPPLPDSGEPVVDSAPPGEDSSPPEDTSPPEDSAPPDDTAPPEDTGPDTWRSALYPEDWTPAHTHSSGHFLHDFSFAGYHAGEAPLPTPPGPSFDVTAYGADPTGAADSAAAVQAAIAAASAAAPAVVDFPAGTFRLDSALRVSTSGVVLRGQGPAATFLYFTQGEGVSYAAHLTFAGSQAYGTESLLTADGANRGSTLSLASVDGLAVGTEVVVGFTITDAFVADHQMTDVWYSFNGLWRPFFRRTLTAVDPTTNTVTLDVPLRYDVLLRDGASLKTVSGQLTECGLQDLAISNVNDWSVAWTESQTQAVSFSGVKDCWVKSVVSWESPLSTDGRGKHLMSGGIEVADSRRVTIADSVMEHPQNRGDGGNGYLFQVARSNEVLTADSTARDGRHNFIQNWDFGNSGCVWLRTVSEDGRAYLADWDPIGYVAYSEFHHSLAMANLIDQSEASDGWQAVNRQGESSGAGHSATQTVWWNLQGGGYLRSLQYGDGYVVGTLDMDIHVDPTEWDWNNSGEGTEPEDWVEGEDLAPTLEPQSLYEDQLARRLASP